MTLKNRLMALAYLKWSSQGKVIHKTSRVTSKISYHDREPANNGRGQECVVVRVLGWAYFIMCVKAHIIVPKVLHKCATTFCVWKICNCINIALPGYD